MINKPFLKEENVEMEERMDKMVGLSEKVFVGLKKTRLIPKFFIQKGK